MESKEIRRLETVLALDCDIARELEAQYVLAHLLCERSEHLDAVLVRVESAHVRRDESARRLAAARARQPLASGTEILLVSLLTGGL